MKRLLPLALLALAVPAFAGEKKEWTVDDVVLSEEAHSFEVSPDRRWVVWVKEVPDEKKGEHVAHLFRTELATGRETRLTRGKHGCSSPRWSPDGKRVAFLSGRPAPGEEEEEEKEARTRLWLIDPFGGEPWPAADFPREVSAFGWAGDGALVFVAQELPARREKTLEEKKDETLVAEDEEHEPPARLWRVDLKTEKVTRLTDNADRIEALAVSPDGRRAVTTHSRSLRYVYDNKVKPAHHLVDLAAGRRERILDDPRLIVRKILWAPDGKGVYVVNDHNSRPQYTEAGVPELLFYDLGKKTLARVDLDWPRGLGAQVANDWEPGVAVTRDGFFALLADGVRHRLARFRRTGSGWERSWLGGEHAGNVFGLASSADGERLVYAHSTASVPTQWYHAVVDGDRLVKPAALAKVNERLDKLPKARSEVMTWEGAGGERVEGILYWPHGHEEGKRYPLVVMIHGGPASADFDAWEESWAYAANLFCQRGCFVLKPNYHGSSNYGLEWLESITGGRYAEPEVEDIEKGVDALIGRGLVDGKKLGVLGWSNGAILTNHLVTRTMRYRAASAGAGNIEYVSDWANCEFGEAFNRFYLGRSPLEDPDLYRRKSPFYRLDRVRTPTLIIFGADDRVVPTQQGWVHYRGLQQLGHADTRLVIFPGEKHSLEKLAHRRRKLQEELAWFDRHLFGTAKGPEPFLAEDSPLAWALARAKAGKAGSRYGALHGGTLIPETVEHEGLLVGRFEVTRAQYTASLGQDVEPGKENLPASGVTFKEARAYCKWLSGVTGHRYRLPTEEEAEALYDTPAAKENTLDHWAGYAPNPEDAARLREKVKGLGGEAPLLREVGSFAGSAVFDLGGNVAEWAEGKAGGVLRGGSADRPGDPRGVSGEPAPAYRGFRVVREP